MYFCHSLIAVAIKLFCHSTIVLLHLTGASSPKACLLASRMPCPRPERWNPIQNRFKTDNSVKNLMTCDYVCVHWSTQNTIRMRKNESGEKSIDGMWQLSCCDKITRTAINLRKVHGKCREWIISMMQEKSVCISWRSYPSQSFSWASDYCHAVYQYWTLNDSLNIFITYYLWWYYCCRRPSRL